VVLVVEDEPAIADLLRMYLSREGFQVLVEADGQEALTAVDRPPSVLHPARRGTARHGRDRGVPRLRAAGLDTGGLLHRT
jgi:hypothetical protein